MMDRSTTTTPPPPPTTTKKMPVVFETSENNGVVVNDEDKHYDVENNDNNNTESCYFIPHQADKEEEDTKEDSNHHHHGENKEEEEEFPKIGIRLSYLLKVFVPTYYQDLKSYTTTQVCELIIKEQTKSYKISYCNFLLLSDSDHTAVSYEPTVFISHAHQYKFIDVMNALKYHFRHQLDVYVWFDLFSINQHITNDWTFEFLSTTFKQSISQFGSVVMIMSPWNNPLPFTRSWCVYEAYCAAITNSKFEIALNYKDEKEFISKVKKNTRGSINYMLTSIKSSKSRCCSIQDQEQIFAVIRKEIGFAKLDSMVFECYRTWVIEIALKYLEKYRPPPTTAMNSTSVPPPLCSINTSSSSRRLSSIGNSIAGRSITSSTIKSISITAPIDEEEDDNNMDDTFVGHDSMNVGHEDDNAMTSSSSSFTTTLSGNNKNIRRNQWDQTSDTWYDSYRSIDTTSQRSFNSLPDNDDKSTTSTSTSSSGASPSRNYQSLLNVLGHLYEHQGKYAEAEKYYKECLKICQVNGKGVSFFYLMVMNSLALVSDLQGKYQLALPLYLECLEVRTRRNGTSHKETLNSINNLANHYRSQGKYQQALPLYLDCLTKRKKVLGMSHYSTMNSINNLATLYRMLGEYPKALNLYSICYNRRKNSLGIDHPSTLSTLCNLANLYGKQGMYDKSLSLYNDTIQTQETRLGRHHPSTVHTIHNFATVCMNNKEFAKASTLFLECIDYRKDQLGINHPSTFLSLHALADSYVYQDMYDEAEPIYIHVLRQRRESLGENHPDVPQTMNDLGYLYCQQERYDEALPLFRKCLKQRITTIGEMHPYTLGTMMNLALLHERRDTSIKKHASVADVDNSGNAIHDDDESMAFVESSNLLFIECLERQAVVIDSHYCYCVEDDGSETKLASLLADANKEVDPTTDITKSDNGKSSNYGEDDTTLGEESRLSSFLKITKQKFLQDDYHSAKDELERCLSKLQIGHIYHRRIVEKQIEFLTIKMEKVNFSKS